MRLIGTLAVAASLLLTTGAAWSASGGASRYAPGQRTQAQCPGPGKSGCAPGQIKPSGKSAKTYTPGYKMKNPMSRSR